MAPGDTTLSYGHWAYAAPLAVSPTIFEVPTGSRRAARSDWDVKFPGRYSLAHRVSGLFSPRQQGPFQLQWVGFSAHPLPFVNSLRITKFSTATAREVATREGLYCPRARIPLAEDRNEQREACG